MDKKFMERALELAKKGEGHTNPNPMVGAVIVKDGRIIGEGYHERCGEGHAEVNAFKNCKEDTSGAEMYVTLEPCSHYGKTPPCADLIISKKIKKVYVGALDPNPLVAGRGVKKLRDAGIEVETEIMGDESRRLNEIFMKYIVKKEPFVLLKAAMTLDGKIATASGESKWISSKESRQDAHRLRNKYMAIMVGIGTVLFDDPLLTCRIEGGKNPVRIVVDSHLRIPLEAKILKDQDKAETIVAIAKAESLEKLRAIDNMGISVIKVPKKDNPEKVDIKELIRVLGSQGIDSVLVEGGSGILGSVVKEKLADKVKIYVAPKLLGGEKAKTPVGGSGILKLEEALCLEELEVERFGKDVALSGRVVKDCLQE
ncbi:MAG: bifunctional diaminohydroxyphosphoribosylaminopyrimidine deaminase/5-amino-6-(5-phosphoribosylamino)uracil reductase RibD [Eubacterium sp.]|nr:bifunctional diaminohydroxyphosphoribosylaminopyrimidine deaminase/5-amino-6-(5-phosphoribosylamino)uracil reductase RibD [Eubacterium sp.]